MKLNIAPNASDVHVQVGRERAHPQVRPDRILIMAVAENDGSR
jgi:hypothetical protein